MKFWVSYLMLIFIPFFGTPQARVRENSGSYQLSTLDCLTSPESQGEVERENTSCSKYLFDGLTSGINLLPPKLESLQTCHKLSKNKNNFPDIQNKDSHYQFINIMNIWCHQDCKYSDQRSNFNQYVIDEYGLTFIKYKALGTFQEYVCCILLKHVNLFNCSTFR